MTKMLKAMKNESRVSQVIRDAINASHQDLETVAARTGIPESTLYKRLNRDPDSFRLWEIKAINRVAPIPAERMSELI